MTTITDVSVESHADFVSQEIRSNDFAATATKIFKQIGFGFALLGTMPLWPVFLLMHLIAFIEPEPDSDQDQAKI